MPEKPSPSLFYHSGISNVLVVAKKARAHSIHLFFASSSLSLFSLMKTTPSYSLCLPHLTMHAGGEMEGKIDVSSVCLPPDLLDFVKVW